MCKCTCSTDNPSSELGHRVGPEIQGRDLMPKNWVTSSGDPQAD